MRGNRGRDTRPERALRSALHALGRRFRANHRAEPDLRCRPDIVFTRAKLAVFVDGCFWHRCPLHGTMPKSNADYWEPKLRANVARDRRVDELLNEHGWTVVRLWEHEDPSEAANRVVDAVRRLRTAAAGPRAPHRAPD